MDEGRLGSAVVGCIVEGMRLSGAAAEGSRCIANKGERGRVLSGHGGRAAESAAPRPPDRQP